MMSSVRAIFLLVTILFSFQIVASITVGGGCYHWYMASTPADLQYIQNDTMTYFVWVVDAEFASAAEGAHDALLPSVFSAFLSEQFNSLGQEPSIDLATESLVRSGLASVVTFNSDARVWNFTFKLMDVYRFMGRKLLISGKDIGLYECSIGNTIVSIKSLSEIRFDEGTAVRVKNWIKKSRLIVEPCEKRTFLVLMSFGILVSQDSLATFQNLTLPVFGSKEVTVLDASILLMGHNSVTVCIVLATDQGLVVLKSSDFGMRPLTTKVLEMDEILDITGVESSLCLCNFHDHRQHMPVVLWNSRELLLTTIDFVKFTEFPIPSSMIIMDVKYTGFRTTFCVVLFKPETKTIVVWLYLKNGTLSELCSWTSDTDSQNYTMTIATNGKTMFYVWNDMDIYYFFSSSNHGKLKVYGSTGSSIGSASDAIKQLVISLKSEVVIFLNSGALYYTKVSLKQVWKVTKTAEPDLILTYDELGSLLQLKVNATEITELPLEVSYLTVDAEYEDLQCPYKDFQVFGMESLNTLILDMNELMYIWMQIALKDNAIEDKIRLESDDFSYIRSRVSLSVYEEENQLSQYKEVRFTAVPEVSQFANRGDTYVGHYGIFVQPNFDSPGLGVCPAPGATMRYIYVGCPGFKFLQYHRVVPQFRKGDPDCDIFQGTASGPYKYTLSKNQRSFLNGSHGETNITVEYDYTNLGCPVTLHYATPFIPVLDLVNERLKTKTTLNGVEFVIYERYNRVFQYNTTAHDAECVRTSQMWKEMLSSSNESEMKYVWTPANYISCFEPLETNNSNLGEYNHAVKDVPYEILNGKVPVSLSFTHSGSLGLYIFTVVVVDQNLSYCHLSTTFAVNVVGKTVRSNIMALYITLISYLFLAILCFLLLYIYFRNKVYRK